MATREDGASRLTRSAEHVQVPIQVPSGDEKDVESEFDEEHYTDEEEEEEEEEEGEEEQQQVRINSLWRAFQRLPRPVRFFAMLAAVMVIYIILLWLKDWVIRHQQERLEQDRLERERASHLPPPYDWRLDSTIAYHVTPHRLDFCTYHPLAPLLHSALLPPLNLSAPDDPTYEDDGIDGTFADPFTLYHLGHRILGYGTVRLHIEEPDWHFDSTHRDDYPMILKNVLYVPTAPEARLSLARLLTWPSNEIDPLWSQIVTVPLVDGTLDFWRPRIYTRIRNGVYLVRAWAWKYGTCEDDNPEGPASCVV